MSPFYTWHVLCELSRFLWLFYMWHCSIWAAVTLCLRNIRYPFLDQPQSNVMPDCCKTGTFCLRSQFPLFLAGCSPWKRSAISLFHSNLFTSAPSGLTQPTSAGELNHKHTLQPTSSHKLFSKSTLIANNLKIAAVCKWCSQGLVCDTDQLHPDWYEFMYVSPPPRSKPGWGTCSLPKCSLMTEFRV